MTELVPPISEEMLKKLPARVSHVAQWLLLGIGVVTTAVSVANEWTHGGELLNHWLIDRVRVLGALLHLVLIALVLFPGRIQPLNHEIRDTTVRAMARTINAFALPALTWFWRCLGLLYVIQLFRVVSGGFGHSALALSGSITDGVPWPSTLLELFSAGSTFFILLAYVYLTPGFLRAQEHRIRHAEDRSEASRLWQWRRCPEFWRTLCIMLPVAAFVVMAHAFPMIESDPVKLEYFATLTNGVASAIAFGFFVGRMDSKFVLNWQWAIPLLYCYAGIQVYSTVLEAPRPLAQAVFTYGAFTMKCILFIFLSNFFESRRVLYYAYEIVATGDRAT